MLRRIWLRGKMCDGRSEAETNQTGSCIILLLARRCPRERLLLCIREQRFSRMALFAHSKAIINNSRAGLRVSLLDWGTITRLVDLLLIIFMAQLLREKSEKNYSREIKFNYDSASIHEHHHVSKMGANIQIHHFPSSHTRLYEKFMMIKWRINNPRKH